MEILLWLAPAAVATCLAMAWATWAGRERIEREPSEEQRAAAAARMAEAIMRPLPSEPRVSRPRERSTGVAVRHNQRRDLSA